MAKFLGSSIVSFNESADFKGSEIALDVNLVDCSIEGDMFSPPAIGSPVLFQFDSHEFFGVVDRYGAASSTSAFPQYSVHVTNGLFLLDGVKLILNDYYGVSNVVPNLVNVFGYLENISFGNSEVNSAGISWAKIASALDDILNDAVGTNYGKCISHKGYKYGIDLSALPAIPNYYRINSEGVSLLEFIGEVCEAGGHDYFIKLEEAPALSPLDGIFRLHTISRLTEPTPGAVASFIASANCASQKEIGQELRKDATSKFVVGANLERMWFVTPSGSGNISGGISSAEYATYNVLPYYGLDVDGNYIVGSTPEKEPDEYYFNIDIRDISHPNLGNTYMTCESELMAAKKGRESWELFISQRSCNKYVMNTTCSGTITAKPFVVPFPTGERAYTTFLGHFPNTSEYFGSLDGYGLGFVPKFGFMDIYSKRSDKDREILPSGMTWDTYYSITNKVDSFTSAMGCEINSNKFSGKLNAFLYYPATDVLNPYFLRGFKIGVVARGAVAHARFMESDLYRLATDTGLPDSHEEYFTNLYNTSKSNLMDNFATSIYNLYNTGVSNRAKYKETFQDKATQLYKKIKELADNYYGKRYLVTIPSLLGAIEPESNSLRLSQVPSDAGYLDESVWDDAYASGLIPELSGVNTLLAPDERFYPFVKVNEAVTYSGVVPYIIPYDYSSFSKSEIVFGTPTTVSGVFSTYDLWIKTSVASNVVYLDNTTLLNPRAIVDLPSSINYDPLGNVESVQALYKMVAGTAKGPAGIFGQDTSFDDEAMNKLLNKFGIDEGGLTDGNKVKTPDLFAVPLRSNVLCYGPWYLAGADGPVVYEKNNDLAPWNYGGFAAMDDAGFARVNDGVSNQTFEETGSVTIVGAPALNIGDQLISGGPYITDISVSAGADGITTQYSFQAWSSQRRLSKLTNFNTERIKRLTEVSRDLRRAYRNGVGLGIYRNPNDFARDLQGKFLNLEDLPRRDKGSTSHSIIAAESDTFGDTVVFQPHYNTSAQIGDNYENKVAMSLDGLFRPYANLPHSGFSSLTFPANTGDINTSFDLYPLRNGIDLKIITGMRESGKIPDEGAGGRSIDVYTNISGVPDYRGIAFKAPVVFQGWGRDTNDDPVPLMVNSSGEPILSSGGDKQFDYDYLYNSKKWKTGPADFRWDDARGVWTMAAEMNILSFQIISSDPFTRSALVEVVGKTFSGRPYDSILEGEVVTVYDTDGCFLNEPNAELTGRKGKATLYYTGIEAIEIHFSGDYNPPKKYWNVISLCCPASICEE